jgi:hypothetical protein
MPKHINVIPFRRKWPPWYQGWQWTLMLVLFLAGFIALLLSGCGGCYERTPDGLGITSCKGQSW